MPSPPLDLPTGLGGGVSVNRLFAFSDGVSGGVGTLSTVGAEDREQKRSRLYNFTHDSMNSSSESKGEGTGM